MSLTIYFVEKHLLAILKFPLNKESCILEPLIEHYPHHLLIIMPKTPVLVFSFPVHQFAFRSLLPMVLLHGEAAFPSWQEKFIEEIPLERQFKYLSVLSVCSGFPSRTSGPLRYSVPTSTPRKTLPGKCSLLPISSSTKIHWHSKGKF